MTSIYLDNLRQEVLDYAAKHEGSLSGTRFEIFIYIIIPNRAVDAFNALQTASEFNLRAAALQGLPADFTSLRAIYWKVLLKYLPLNHENWESVLTSHRSAYKQALAKYILDCPHVQEIQDALIAGASVPPSDFNTLPQTLEQHDNVAEYSNLIPVFNHKRTLDDDVNGANSTDEDDNLAKSSEPSQSKPSEPDIISEELAATNTAEKQNTIKQALSHETTTPLYPKVSQTEWIEDMSVLDQINKDVFRTKSEIGSNVPTIVASTAPRVINIFSPQSSTDVLGRLLFLYSKMHPNVSYVQGMNELLAPICYVMLNSTVTKQSFDKETDAFYCFKALMSIKGHYRLFCRKYDFRRYGVLGRVNHLAQLLSLYDRALYEHLFQKLKIEPQFFALRWILLSLTQEIGLTNGILQIWDALLSEATDNKDPSTQLIYFMCLAILEQLRSELLEGDFSSCMQRLQRIGPIYPHSLIRNALSIRQYILQPKPTPLMWSSVQQSYGLRRAAALSSYSTAANMTATNIQDNLSLINLLVKPSNRLYPINSEHVFMNSNQDTTVDHHDDNNPLTLGVEYAKSAFKGIQNWINSIVEEDATLQQQESVYPSSSSISNTLMANRQQTSEDHLNNNNNN